MLVGIIFRLSSINCHIPLGISESWPLSCLKTELAVSALQVECPALKKCVQKTLQLQNCLAQLDETLPECSF